MGRWVAMAVVVAGWLLLAAAVAAPLVGVGIGLARPGQPGMYVYGVPGHWALLVRSVTLSGIATAGAMVLGLMPAAVLGSARGRRLAVVTGLVLAPLLIPPQVYAYAWQIAISPQALLGKLMRLLEGSWPAMDPWVGPAIKAGLISAAWLWPVVALIVAAGWRSAGRAVFATAILDTTPGRAFFRAVLPSLRPHLLAAGLLVFAVTLVEYAIPHLSLANSYPTSLQTLVDAGAPPRQIMAVAGQVLVLMSISVALAAWILRGVSGWQPVEADEDLQGSAWQRAGRAASAGAAVVWVLSVGLPAAVMLAWLRVPGAWKEGFLLFQREWLISLLVAMTAGVWVVAVAITTVLLRTSGEGRRERLGPAVATGLAVLVAMLPPAALGKGFVLFYNRPGPLGALYQHSVYVWILGLVARYAAIGILIAWLAVGRRANVLADQARADGADRFSLLAWVLIPAVWPSLAAAGMIVVVLSMFEVVVSQMLSPVQSSAIALSILNQMHYGRDDMVITASLIIMVAGILLTQGCGWLLTWRRR